MRSFGIPAAPLALTLAGLIPFAGGAGVIWAMQDEPILKAQAGLVLLAYGAVILSFLGGIRWGAEVSAPGGDGPRAAVLSLSVLGSLAAWALVLWGVLGALDWKVFAAMALAHLLHGVWDSGAASLPAWMRRLRQVATLGAAVSLAAASASYLV